MGLSVNKFSLLYKQHLGINFRESAVIGIVGAGGIGVVLAIPVAFLAASNTTPSKLFIRPVALFIIVASRSINSLIWALLLVSIIGPSLLAGIIAIALRSIGFVAKLLYEAIEETDVKQIDCNRHGNIMHIHR